MKKPAILWGILLCTLSLHLAAQVSPPLHQTLPVKPFLFNTFPDTSIAGTALIAELFTRNPSGTLEFTVSKNLVLQGIILEKIRRNPELLTINIRLTNFDNALFTISKITADDNTVSYLGRIINIRYGDALVVSSEKDRLYFRKEKQSLFLVE